MPKQLILVSAIILCLCAIVSAIVNYQTAVPPKRQRELALLDSDPIKQIDWIWVLSQLPQYKKVEIISESNSAEIVEVNISDGQIIGIVTDGQASVLIYLNQTNEQQPVLLGVGEGWLTHWVIKKINADSVDWFNQQTEQSYKQMLFNHSNVQQQNLTTSKSRIK